jgi:hypothetical protein
MHLHDNLKGSEARLWQLIDERTRPGSDTNHRLVYDRLA